MTTAWEQVTGATRLISLPGIYLQLKEVLDNSDFAMSDIEAVIDKDPAITVRLLRMVNSAYFGLAVEIATVSRAINLLGSQQIHELVLATSVSDTFHGMSNEVMDMRVFWRNSVYCAAVSRLLADSCNVLDSERLFVSGLLHDIGHLVMYQVIPDVCQQILVEAREHAVPVDEMERNSIGFDYAMVGAYLMRHWNLPKSLQESTQFHLQPERADEFAFESAIIHIASKMTAAYANAQPLEQDLDNVSSTAWQVTGVDREQCSDLDQQARGQVESLISMIFPDNTKSRASA